MLLFCLSEVLRSKSGSAITNELLCVSFVIDELFNMIKISCCTNITNKAIF